MASFAFFFFGKFNDLLGSVGKFIKHNTAPIFIYLLTAWVKKERFRSFPHIFCIVFASFVFVNYAVGLTTIIIDM